MKPISQIATLREQAGLTQRELALAVGVTETTIANWERGRSGVEWIERLLRLCRTLDCQLGDLITYDTADEAVQEPSFEELRQMYRAGRLSTLSAPQSSPDL